MQSHLGMIVLLSIGSTTTLAGSNCPAGGTTLFFSNGVATELPHAQSTLNTLKYNVDHALSVRAPHRDPSCVQYKLAYDSEFFDQTNLLATTASFILQLSQAAVDARVVDWAHVKSALYQGNDSIPSPPDSWGDAVAQLFSNKLLSIVSNAQPNVQRHRALYQSELDAGNSVLVVAHSQGNLYVAQAYGLLGAPDPDRFTTLALATPANNVAGNGPWLTLNHDLILHVPGALHGTADNGNHPDRCGSSLASQYRCHDMDASYLLGDTSGPQIINVIVSYALRKLTVVESGSGSGTVTSMPPGIDCGLTCSVQLDRGTAVSLTAMPDPGSAFFAWTGDCTGTSPTTTVTLTSVRTCTASYKLTTLAVSKTGNGMGTVTSSPAAINCGPACPTQSAPFTGLVQLTAASAPGSIFSGWSGDCAIGGSNTTVQVTVNSANPTLGCGAMFSIGGQLTITKNGTGTGTVISAPAGINCGPACVTQMAPFAATPPVQLMATVASGSTFMGWGGDCAGMTAVTMINVTADKNCTAAFGESLPAVRLNPFGNQDGTVPYNVQVVASTLSVTPAPRDITVTLLREVFSNCSGLLFSSNRTVVVTQGQSSATFNFDSGHDPACRTLPITTVYTLTNAVLAPNTALDLTGVPAQQRKLYSIH